MAGTFSLSEPTIDPPGRPPLAGTTSAGRGRIAVRGEAGMGGSPTSPGRAPRAGPGVCGLGARGLARPVGLAGIAPPPPHNASGEGPGHTPGGGQGPHSPVARLA